MPEKAPRPAYAEPQPGIFSCPQMTLDVAETVVPAVRPAWPGPQLSERQVDVIAYDQEIGDVHLVKIERLPHRIWNGALGQRTDALHLAVLSGAEKREHEDGNDGKRRCILTHYHFVLGSP